MPELPEVETVMRGLQPVMENARLTRLELRRDGLRFPFPQNMAGRLEKRKIIALSRRAKYILVDFEGGDTLFMHLGMSGSYRIELDDEAAYPGVFHHDRSKMPEHDHVVFHLEGGFGLARVIYNDPRRFGYMDICQTRALHEHKLFSNLGVEPVGNSLDGDMLAGLFHGKNTPVKAALLDQRNIAGLGNIYVCEALWMSGISPKRKAGSLVRKDRSATKRADLLSRSVRDVIARAIDAGGSSLRDHRQADGSLGYFQHSFNVYGREGKPCRTPGCNGVVRRITQAGRSTFYCPTCQR